MLINILYCICIRSGLEITSSSPWMQQEKQAGEAPWQLRESSSENSSMPKLFCSTPYSPKPSGHTKPDRAAQLTQFHPAHLCPDKFSGETTQWKGLLLQCFMFQSPSMLMSLIIRKYHSSSVCSQGKPSDGLQPYGSKAMNPCHDDCFIKLFQRVFDHTPEGKEIREQLITIM